MNKKHLYKYEYKYLKLVIACTIVFSYKLSFAQKQQNKTINEVLVATNLNTNNDFDTDNSNINEQSDNQNLIPLIIEVQQYQKANLKNTDLTENTNKIENNAYSYSGTNLSQAITNSYNKVNIGVSSLLKQAVELLGYSYRYGGNSPLEGFDCSGFVSYLYNKTFGLVLPRRSEEISRVGNPVNIDELKQGDLVFFNTLGKKYSHLGIYMGEGKFIHSASRRSNVRIDNMSNNYWSKRYNGARRIVDL